MNSGRQSASTWGTMQRTRKPRGHPTCPPASQFHPTLRVDSQSGGRWPAGSARIGRNCAGTRHSIASCPAGAGRAPAAGRDPRRSGRAETATSGRSWRSSRSSRRPPAGRRWRSSPSGPARPPRPRPRSMNRSTRRRPIDTDVPPVADTHDALELESLLPAKLNETALQPQSWDGDGLPDRRSVEPVDHGVPDRSLQGPGRPPRRPGV